MQKNIQLNPSAAGTNAGAKNEFAEGASNRANGSLRLYSTYYKVRSELNRYFVNRTPLFSIGKKPFTIVDVVTSAILSKSNMYFIGTRSSAKTLLAEAIYKSIFNEEGFFFRGDPNQRPKDLYIQLNLNGKTEAEIYEISKSIKFPFVLIDELNRMPGIVQNTFLPLLDGSIELRGVKYELGTGDYLLMVGTANPARNGDYTGVFDEDMALLDRISLIINFDLPLAGGDAFEISYRSIEKRLIPKNGLTQEVISAYSSLCEIMKEDQFAVTLGLLSEFTYNAFRYVKTTKGTIDKLADKNWRDRLDGEHAGGLVHPFCSEVSIRKLIAAKKLGVALFKIAEEEHALRKELGMQSSMQSQERNGLEGFIAEIAELSEEELGMKQFIDSYFYALKAALTLDRHFIPPDLAHSKDRSEDEMLETAINEVKERLGDADVFEKAAALMMEFIEEEKNGAKSSMQNIINDLGNSKTEIGQLLFNILKSRILNSGYENELDKINKKLEEG